MSRNREDLSATAIKGDQDLNPGFTYEEMQRDLWNEIDQCFPAIEYRQEGDIDKRQYRAHLIARGENLSDETIRERMFAMGEQSGWQYLEVYDPSIKRKIKVLRKIDDTNV
ncbi:MAG: hypothetical protein PHV98_00790 [Candidatus Omnitrophica bacterium]|nr:hypothetical protein [Candidatus Omnitrophota bacterium]